MERDAHQAFFPDPGTAAAASGEPSSTGGIRLRSSGRRRTVTSSAVWNYFHRDAASTTTATCKFCGKRMRAISRCGTSSLWRHIQTKRCVAARAAEHQWRRQVPALLGPAAAADEPSVTVAEEEPWWVVSGTDVPRLMDHLRSEGLEHIDQTDEAVVNSKYTQFEISSSLSTPLPLFDLNIVQKINACMN